MRGRVCGVFGEKKNNAKGSAPARPATCTGGHDEIRPAGSPVKLLVLHVGLTVASCEVDMGLILVKSVSIFMNPYSIDIDLSIEY